MPNINIFKNNFSKVLLILIPLFVVLLLSSSNALAAANTTQTYTRWAAANGTADQGGIFEVSGHVLTAIGIGGDFPDCSLYIKTAPVENGQAIFNKVSDWTQRNCGAGAGTAEKVSDYISNSVITGWNWAITSDTNAPICYYQEYAPLNDISSKKQYFDSCITNRNEKYPKLIFPAPAGSVIVGIGLSVSPGYVSGLAVKRISLTPPPAVAQVDNTDGQRTETPVTQNIQAETNKIVQLYVSNADPTQGEYYSWQLTSGSGAYVPNNPDNYSAGQYVNNLNTADFKSVSPGSSITTGPFLKIAFSLAGDKKIKVTKGTLETNFAITVSQPAPGATRFECEVTSANRETGKAISMRALGTDFDNGYYAWSSSPDGSVTSTRDTASVVYNTSGLKTVTVSHTVAGATVSAFCSLNVVQAPTPPTCQITAPAEADRKTNTQIAVKAAGGNGTYTWSVLPDGSVFSDSLDSAVVMFNTPGKKGINVSSAGMTGACIVDISESDVCPNISGNQATVPEGMIKDADGNCVTPPPGVVITPLSCDVVSPKFILDRKVGTPITMQAKGGDSQKYTWDFLLSKFLNDTLWKGTIIPATFDTATATFASSGPKIITVKSGGLDASCTVVVFSQPSSQPPATLALSCQAKPSSLAEQKTGTPIEVEALGGNGTYKWEVLTEGTIVPISSNSASAIFNNLGTNIISVSSANLTSSCSVYLFEEESAPPQELVIEEFPAVSCSPAQSEAEIGKEITFSATGGNNDYEWGVSEGTIVPNSPNSTARITFYTGGEKTVSVKSAGSSDICLVTVPRPKPEVNIWASPSQMISFPFDAPVPPEAHYDISWSSANADSCSASGDWSGSKLPNGSESFTRTQRDTYNHKITCSNPAGSASDEVSVKITEIPRCEFTAEPPSIIPPQSSTLKWFCRYATSCSIDNGIGSASLNPSADSRYKEGSVQVRPQKTTTFALTCNGADGTNSFQTIVSVSFTPWLKEVIPIWR
ncbi:MAG: hypothetical protein V1794_13185 [Candidatus Glassbacteria bacterium]